MSYITAPGYKLHNGRFFYNSAETRTDRVIEAVLNYFKMDLQTLTKKCRKREIVYAREVCMWMLRKHTAMSLLEIGKLLGGKDHTTVIHARDRINDLIDAYPHVLEEIVIIQSNL